MTTQPSLLSCIELNNSTTVLYSIIWMHGLGADANDFTPFVKELSLTNKAAVRFIFPNAPLKPITINNGYVMRAWYNITSLSKIDGHVDDAGIDQSVAQINQLVQKELDRGIPHDNIILAGFSQGAVIALVAGLRSKQAFGGIVALSGYLPYSTAVLKDQVTTSLTTPVFLGHGIEDNVVPYFLAKQTADTLTALGFNIHFQSYPMGHSVCPDEIEDISDWINKVFV
jgi:phospholipase/carboxylesterase